jgi:hypothetical protein
VGLIDELPLGDPNSLGSDMVSQQLFDTQVGLRRWCGYLYIIIYTKNSYMYLS